MPALVRRYATDVYDGLADMGIEPMGLMHVISASGGDPEAWAFTLADALNLIPNKEGRVLFPAGEIHPMAVSVSLLGAHCDECARRCEVTWWACQAVHDDYFTPAGKDYRRMHDARHRPQVQFFTLAGEAA